MTYASIVNNKLDKEDNKPTFNATVVNNDGNEFVIFDEELVQKGSSKWRLTICGYFVGCNMSSNELNYHLRRMWRVGKVEYARVLVEFDVKKGFKDKIVIQYRDKDNVVKERERERTEDEIADMKKSKEIKEDANEGFTQVNYNRNGAARKVNNYEKYQGRENNEQKGFVYASNSGVERKQLWKELKAAKTIINDNPWMLSGDFNVTINLGEHYAGSSNITNDMQDFINCTNSIEVEDIGSSGLFFTWIKSPLKASASIMKKLDRIMVNEGFMRKFEAVGGFFLPFLTSNHSASVLTVPNSVPKKTKSFRFTNYITDKPEFILVVEEGWKTE
ncbi:RNA-directed DNA polymerase, eukaryota, reverse transcriptase zinc-binding domain protein, partial [Tanacetum coccineum]